MCKYIEVIASGRDTSYFATARNVIVNSEDVLVYAELTGRHSAISKSLRGVLNGISGKNKTNVSFIGGVTTKTEKNSYITKVQSLVKNMGFATVYNKSSFRGKDANIIIGRNSIEIQESFKNWLTNSQPLPYPRGYVEDLGKTAEEELFNILVGAGYIIKLSEDFEHTILAYEISQDILNASERMQKAILKVVKNSNLLEVDRVRKILATAPDIGESDSDNRKVYVSLRDKKASISYFVIEYDKYEKNVFCLVEKDGHIEWEEHNFENLFKDDNIAMLKGDEYEDICIDVDGNISKLALAA